MYNRKVCILTTVHPPFDGRIFHRAAKTLAVSGYNVALIATHDKCEVVDGIRIIPMAKRTTRVSRMFRTLSVLLLAIKQKADFYHFHDPELLPAGILLKIFTNAKVIYDVHEDHPETMLSKYYLPRSFRPYMSCIFDIFEKSVSRLFDYIIPATEGIEKHFKHVSKKTSVVKNYPTQRPVSKRKYNRKMASDQHTLICTGGFAEQYGINEEVRCLGFIRDFNVKLKLIGKFHTKVFEDKVKSFPEFQGVEFLGWVPYEEVCQHLLTADVGLVTYHPLPYMIDALPTKIFEYMSAGLPIVASNFPLWERIILENKCGLTVNPLDPQEIAKEIEYLLGNPEERRKMGENGRKAFMEKYNWDHEKKKLLQIYEALS